MVNLLWLKTEKDFASFRSSKSYQTPFLRIRVAYSHQNTPRFGFIIPKKVLPKVVDRNKLKRRIKTFLTRNAAKIKTADVLIFPYAGLLKKKYSELEIELSNLFTKANLWKS